MIAGADASTEAFCVAASANLGPPVSSCHADKDAIVGEERRLGSTLIAANLFCDYCRLPEAIQVFFFLNHPTNSPCPTTAFVLVRNWFPLFAANEAATDTTQHVARMNAASARLGTALMIAAQLLPRMLLLPWRQHFQTFCLFRFPLSQQNLDALEIQMRQ